MYFHCTLISVILVIFCVYDASWKPFTHLIQHIHTIIYLEVRTSTPLFLDSQAPYFNPFVVFSSETCKMNKDSTAGICVVYLADFPITPLVYSVETVNMFTHVKLKQLFLLLFFNTLLVTITTVIVFLRKLSTFNHSSIIIVIFLLCLSISCF